jgi:hypothetical protein
MAVNHLDNREVFSHTILRIAHRMPSITALRRRYTRLSSAP